MQPSYVVLLAALATGCASSAPTAIEWPSYGGDPGGSRYSPARQIDRTNVARLRVAWTYHTHALDVPGPNNDRAAFEATPILADGTLYVVTPFNRVIALEPHTGRERWSYDPAVPRARKYSEVTSRGVTIWRDRTAPAGQPCARRIFMGTLDARLIALDADRGIPCRDFAREGTIDLSRGVGVRELGDYQMTSPPAVLGDVVIVGSSIGDNRRIDLERGTVRAFDARTGAPRWSWDPIPPSANTGAANAWAPLAVDEARDLVFVPTGSASPDFYGGQRRGDNRWANSVVALRGRTGEFLWGFQAVHHDLWDYDVPAQPTLTTVHKDGVARPAVIVATKMSHLFVLDRDTGKPIFPVEERPVPPSDVPGEEAARTQPFPILPAPIDPQRVTADDIWGPTPELREACLAQFRSLRHEGLFTPPSLGGTLVAPGNFGGATWGGLSVDPKRRIAVVYTNRVHIVVKLIPRAQYGAERERIGERMHAEFAPQSGAPYAMHRDTFLSPAGTPCTAPPWGALTAIDLNTGTRKWQIPLGDLRNVERYRGLGPGPATGTPGFGAPLLTGSGLAFMAGAMDDRLRAFDVESGRELWHAVLPAGAQATPMTYVLDGRQYIVIAAGGHGKIGTKLGDSVVAFALP